MTKQEWLDKGLHWKDKWSQFLPEYEDDSDGINMYKFTEILNKYLKSDSVILSDAGSCGYVLAQSLKLKDNQRYLPDSAQMAMGAAIPMGIGACLANDNKQVIVITGDGSFQSSLSALSTITYYRLPIIIIVWNNNGYLSINNTCDSFYDGRRFGTDSTNGLFFPEIKKIAELCELDYIYIQKIEELDLKIQQFISSSRPTIVEVKCWTNQKITPGLAMKNGKSCELHDMAPFISDSEMEKEMIKD
jgi:acetolactate synthase-1/2/3 large subunit